MLLTAGHQIEKEWLAMSENAERPKPLFLKRIDREQLKKIRLAGIKKGNIKSDQPLLKRKKVKTAPRNDLLLSQLGVTKKTTKALKRNKTTDFSKNLDRINSKNFKEIPTVKVKEGILYGRHQVTRLKNTSKDSSFLSEETERALKGSSLEYYYDPPKGVPLSELNSLEKIFYSFQKRTRETTITAMFRSLERNKLSKPKLLGSLKTDKHVLKGKVTFDTQGNIVKIKILNWSNDDQVQTFFEDALKLLKFPNPPKAFVLDDGTFEFTITLYVNVPKY